MTSAADLTVERYFVESAKTDRFSREPAAERAKRLAFGLFGEVGGLLAGLKKSKRDALTTSDAEVANEELGDALWYLVAMARLFGVGAAAMCVGTQSNLCARIAGAERSFPIPLTFTEFDAFAGVYQSLLVAKEEELLRDLARDCGALVGMSHVDIAALDSSERGLLFGRVCAGMVLVAGHFRLSFKAIAEANLRKISDRWTAKRSRKYVELSHRGDFYEQFPKKLTVSFYERRGKVVQQISGLNIGDPLTDNNAPPDGYRFHDIFHWSYVVHLGWSPVIRALLKLKRKSVQNIDENEDGARAIIIEEGIATWIFNYAQRHDKRNYDGVKDGSLEYAILKQVRAMVRVFDVADLPLWQWEVAILDGFRVFRELLANGGGIVHLDLYAHTLRYERLRTPRARA